MSSLEPTFHGYILSNEDALFVIEAALDRKFPLVQRRPLDSERPELIRSGNVFVFIEEASDIKRWTDGIAWSASRILGRFLIYRKLDRNALLSKDDKKKANKLGKRKGSRDLQYPGETDAYQRRPTYPISSNMRDLYSHYDNIDPNHPEPSDSFSQITPIASRPSTPGTPIPVAQDRGLMKKTLSVTIPSYESDTGTTKTIHLISYFSAHDVLAGNLMRPSQTELRNRTISPPLWSAIRRSSLGGKLLAENDANYYLDSNYQLQNMTSLYVNDDKLQQAMHQEARNHLAHDLPRRYSSVYPVDSFKAAPMTAPVSAPTIAPFRGPLSAPLSAPLRSPSIGMTSAEPHFFPDNEYYTRKPLYEDPPRKRSRSLQTESLNSQYPSAETLAPDESAPQQVRKHSDMMQSYVPSSMPPPPYGGSYRDFRAEAPYASTFSETPVYEPGYYGPGMFRNVPAPAMHHAVAQESADNGYEPYSASSVPTSLNNRAFGLQVSQQAPQKPFVFGNVPAYPYLAHQRWDGVPPTAPLGAAPRLDAPTEEVEYDHHEIYE